MLDAIHPLVALTESALEEIIGDGVDSQILDGSKRALEIGRGRIEAAERLERPRARRQNHSPCRRAAVPSPRQLPVQRFRARAS